MPWSSLRAPHIIAIRARLLDGGKLAPATVNLTLAGLRGVARAAWRLGTVVAPVELTPETARHAVQAVLADPTYRQNAERIRDEMAALPGPEHAVALLERLGAEKQPLLAAR